MRKIDHVDAASISACILAQKGDRSLRQLCADSGLAPSDNALLSKLLRGEAVSVATLRRIGRALGCIPPARRLIRRVLTPAQAAAWDRLTQAQRDKALGL